MSDSTLYLYTSLTAGSSHIVTATARLETILKANKLPFRAIDVATDDAARKLWGRRSKGKKLPGLVKFGTVVGDLEEIEEWNEYGELRMQVNSVEDLDSLPATSGASAAAAQPDTTSSASTPTPSSVAAAETAVPKQSTIKIQNPPAKEAQKDDSITIAFRQAGEEAASKAKENNTNTTAATTTATKTESAAPTVTATATATAPPPAAAPAESSLAPAASEDTATATPTDTTSKQEKTSDATVRRPSVAPEIAENGPRRPPLVPECAAESSANLRADNAEALGLIEHHRGSIVSATSPEEKKQVAQDLRKSISGDRAGIVDDLKREEKRGRGRLESETVEEEPVVSSEEEGDLHGADKHATASTTQN